MAPKPIIFAMANPDPEITPPEAKAARPDAIIATGRSDYPNQVNNVLGFPFIFRGALDVHATTINEEMKIAAAQALAALARQQVPEEVALAYGGAAPHFGPDYIIPAPFDPRLMEVVPAAVAEAAMRTGVARKPIEDMAAYREELRGRLSPTTSVLNMAHAAARANPKRVVFAEAEEEVVLRAAIAFRDGGYGTPVLVGRDEVPEKLRELGIDDPSTFELHNSRISPLVPRMVDHLYARLQRQGYLRREVEALVNQDRNIFGALLLALGEADAMITGITRTYDKTLGQVRLVLDPQEGRKPCGIGRRSCGCRTPCSWPTRWSPNGRAPGSSPPSPSIRRTWRGAWATSRASPSSATRPSATRPATGSTMYATPSPSSTSASPASNMRARWRRTWRSTRR